MATVTVFIERGTVTFLDLPMTAGLRIGPSVTRRASHVEPSRAILRAAFHTLRGVFGDTGRVADFTRQWACDWRINMRPSGGPVLPKVYSNRDEAIQQEINYFNQKGCNCDKCIGIS